MARLGSGWTAHRESAVLLGLWGLATLAGCGIGTDPALTTEDDGAVTRPVDAAPTPNDGTVDASSVVPTRIPPIDRMTYETKQTATFSLG